MASVRVSRDVASFKKQYDRMAVREERVRAGLAAMRKRGREEWCREGELAKAIRISTNDLSALRALFLPHVVETGKTRGHGSKYVWFADPKAAVKARAVVAEKGEGA